MADSLGAERAWVREAVAAHADAWDAAGAVPVEVLRKLGAAGLLCAQVDPGYGGRGASSLDNGEFTAFVGALCSSTRSVMTSQGMAAWTIARLGDRAQHRAHLPGLVSGQLAAVAMSEPGAGSDLTGMRTEIRPEGDAVVIEGRKRWTTAARFADLLVVFGRFGEGAAAVVVPTDTPGVGIRPVAAPLGCRAAGHAHLDLDGVRVPAANVLGGGGPTVGLLVTAALTYGRFSVAWGCVGILRACLAAATGHAVRREQFGVTLDQHQLVARHLAELYVAERAATRACEHASQCWDGRTPDVVGATLLAKYTSARHAAAGAATAVQVLASAGAEDHGVVARAYRDAKLMEIIEGSNEICELMLARQAILTSHLDS
ncbi:acyl-CoA dehydrogenase family protein [Nocardia sp. CDC159]|uniref:Acyl-CoA dehydrogenase family protein n=1 Tax=Nocardia pulmonis TaxID=2951408 RepID=A0A9X2EEJ9_9NOCA|nr:MULTISPECIES: acyl-CoA dehydrogenase family protein [Nocardia]MCM6779029.1 acyl-CoA dehydrogenase family protein [Nocardia pulmonis]MCM6791919.1 acyl-CoA dehydrogenase family protein [Nocardia sp. CDC159]